MRLRVRRLVPVHRRLRRVRPLPRLQLRLRQFRLRQFRLRRLLLRHRRSLLLLLLLLRRRPRVRLVRR